MNHAPTELEVPKVVYVKAASIVSIDVGSDRKLICFKYNRDDLERLKSNIGQVVDMQVEDESGTFTSERPFLIVDVAAPNRFTRCPDNVLIIDLEQQ